MQYEFQTKPFDHQKTAIAKAWQKAYFAYLMEQGTGKSKVLLDDIAIQYEMGRIDQAALIPYKGVYAEWATKEMMQHWPERHKSAIHLWQGMNTVRERKAWERFLARDDVFKFFIINVEAFQSGTKAIRAMEEFAESGRTLGAIDESSRIKSHKSVRTKSLLRLSSMFNIRRILTGTVSPNDPGDVFTQFQFLQPGLLGHNSYYGFRKEFCVEKEIEVDSFNKAGHAIKRKINIIVGAKNESELSRRMEPWRYRVLKNDCLDLPDKIYQVREFDLDPDQARVYADIRDFATAELGEGSFVSAQQAITLLLRLHQTSCGFTVDEDGVEHWLGDSRIKACMDITEDTDGKIIFWSGFRTPLRKLVEALRKRYGQEAVVEYHGDRNLAQRREAIDAFQSGKARFFVGTQQAGGMGITLTAASTVVYYSNTFNLEHRLQSEDRAHRIGQRNNVTYYDLVARGTADRHIVKSLRKKFDIAARIQGDDIREWLTG